MEQIILLAFIVFVIIGLIVNVLFEDPLIKSMSYVFILIIVSGILYLLGHKILSIYFIFFTIPVHFFCYVLMPRLFHLSKIQRPLFLDENKLIKKLALLAVLLLLMCYFLGNYRLGPIQYSILSLSILEKIVKDYFILIPACTMFFLVIEILIFMEIDNRTRKKKGV